MLVCPNCQTQQLDGTIFCLECGAGMQLGLKLDTTRQIGAGHGPQIPGLASRTPADAATAHEPSMQLTLVIAHNGHRIALDLSDELLIGRADTGKGIQPDIDLGPEGGYDAGVSRRHAILSNRNGAYIVEDLGSANGTFVNGRRLAPQTAVQINGGDELKCGTLVMLIEVAR
jgi:hypothetical protein